MPQCLPSVVLGVLLTALSMLAWSGLQPSVAAGARTRRNLLAFGLAVAGVALLTDVRFEGQPLGFAFALANCLLLVLYVVLGHRIARDGGSAGIDRLGAAMLIALLVVIPVGLADAAIVLGSPPLLLADIGVGICSSVIPYVRDQLAMARLPHATFALMLSLLPACAAIIGVIVPRQMPHPAEIVGVVLVVGGVAAHQPSEGS